jgi:hypothetical protein
MSKHWLCTIFLFLVPLKGNAFRVTPNAFQPFNIFYNDKETRTAATQTQILWTVNLRGCTGFMLTPKYLMTAAHCAVLMKKRKFFSGACLADYDCTETDLNLVKILESNAELDYLIAEVSWSNTNTRMRQLFTPKVLTKKEDALVDGSKDAAVFTVGFPADKKPTAFYSSGHLRKRKDSTFYFNAGIINGNSGGGLWRSSDHTLVSLTNAGPQRLYHKGWDNNDPEKENTWNWGPAMDAIYDKSELLQELFVNGVNELTDSKGQILDPKK